MTEVTPEPFDLDAWLDGARRTERFVTVYARADLLAEIDKLEMEKRTVEAIPNEEDRPLGGGGVSGLQAKIDALSIRLDESKLELRVSFLDDEEQAAIRRAVRKDLKAVADTAAAEARSEAMESCSRLQVTDPKERNQVALRMANDASNAVFDREIVIRTMAQCIVEPKFTAEQVGKLYTKLGDSQVALVSQAMSRAAIEAPEVQVPKSLKPSPDHDGAMSS